ncbi:adapter protein MecA 1/2 [Virgibacillus subterraneus]|uniref:Adapter protein MecA n=2 Tax=Virgibacillus TaxID=84406 RepID=A0A1H1EKX4_9BACI|nr:MULTISPECIES: adaptor protein MecA [Virgibacillus]SDQ88796.1 adapter protein MecA 1/2 [Virgibacillus salinus]SEQ44102.1 adapter protein MecA 1/2 [Virgibacillus subterraneus]
MEIERINENTVKFYISYIDIEDRGFEREEIWYNRERSEQLFWQMMDEVNYKEDFNVEGPLWIQVQALDKGLEIVVTKAQVSKNGENIELPTENGKTIDISVDDKIEDMLDDKFGEGDENSSKSKKEEDEDGNLSLSVMFNDFEDVIQLSHYFQDNKDKTDKIEDTLFHYDNKYYLYIEFPQDEEIKDEHQEDLISQIFEFANDTEVTIHFLEEYGKQIFADNTFEQVRSHFPAIIGRS